VTEKICDNFPRLYAKATAENFAEVFGRPPTELSARTLSAAVRSKNDHVSRAVITVTRDLEHPVLAQVVDEVSELSVENAVLLIDMIDAVKDRIDDGGQVQFQRISAATESKPVVRARARVALHRCLLLGDRTAVPEGLAETLGMFLRSGVAGDVNSPAGAAWSEAMIEVLAAVSRI
jgi:hypothetical protein